MPQISPPALGSSRSRRVLHVISPSRMAGAETFLARLLRRTPAELLQLSCLSNRSAANDEMRAAGMVFETAAIGGKANVLAMRHIRRAANRCHANLLHSHLSSASWWCGWLESYGGPPSIGHVHGFTSALWHRRQTHLIACSDAVKQDLVGKGISDDRVTVMHNPLDPNDQLPMRPPGAVRDELGVPADAAVVGTFAHLSVKKGYRELVRAAELVLKQLPSTHFLCCGEGPLRAELQQYALQAGIVDRFHLLGFRRDVPDVMRAIDVMCLPSHREPFGLAYVEAALAERPVIACRAGGTSEVVESGVTGLLIPPPFANRRLPASAPRGDNIEPLAEALLTVLENRGHARIMGRQGRAMALDRFGWPRYLERLADVYERVLASPGGRRSRRAA